MGLLTGFSIISLVEIIYFGVQIIINILKQKKMKQGRSCKQICWPPGFDGLQRVGLDPGQYDHHPHGVVHVGQLQDV